MCVSTAEWQVMCVFKALHADPSNQHSELSEAEFSDFYEVQNLKWREVSGSLSLTQCGTCSFNSVCVCVCVKQLLVLR